jgi:hypothetical protein
MSWSPEDAPRFTKKADTEEKKSLWARTANSILENTQDKTRAVRLANAAVRDATMPPEGSDE